MDTPALEAVLLPETSGLSAVILVMMEWDRERAQLVRRLKSRGVAVRIFMTGPESRPAGLESDEFIEAFQ